MRKSLPLCKGMVGRCMWGYTILLPPAGDVQLCIIYMWNVACCGTKGVCIIGRKRENFWRYQADKKKKKRRQYIPLPFTDPREGYQSKRKPFFSLSFTVQTDAEQRTEPLFRVQPVRQPDLRVHLLHFLGYSSFISFFSIIIRIVVYISPWRAPAGCWKRSILRGSILKRERKRERVLDLIGFYSRSKVCKAEKQSWSNLLLLVSRNSTRNEEHHDDYWGLSLSLSKDPPRHII